MINLKIILSILIMASYLHAFDLDKKRYVSVNTMIGKGTQSRDYSDSYINNYYEQKILNNYFL